MARREEEDLLAVRGLHDLAHVVHHERAPCHAAQVDGLEVGEQAVVALDCHHRLVRLDLVALVERVDVEPAPVVRAQLEDRDRLIDATQQRMLLLEDLHHHVSVLVLVLE